MQHQHAPANTYGAMTGREIKALSAEQIADLQAGRGMGLSLPAELNGYPGPKHVLELADGLALTTSQRDVTTRFIEQMTAEAMPIGARLIAHEKALDRLFVERTATEVAVRTAIDDIARAQAELRFTHVKFHLAMAAALTPQQSARYAELRGYAIR